MRTYDISRPPELINIGFDGENKWRPRGFNCTNWLQKHPDGIITLWIQPEGVRKAFPVSTTKIENTIVWYPLSEELYPGTGKLQLIIQDGEFIGKSDTIKFEVNKSLVSGGAHPDSQPSWATQIIQDVTEQVNRAEVAARTVTDAAEDITSTIMESIPEAIDNYFDEHPVVVEESDPTVPEWAKQPEKPTYTADEVGALSNDTEIPVVPEIATRLDRADWETGKVVDAATLANNLTFFDSILTTLTNKLNAVADSDDTTLDQLSEIITYIKNNKNLIDSITTQKINISDIIDNLISNDAKKPLSANQGRILKELINDITIPTKVSDLDNDSGFQTAAQIQETIDAIPPELPITTISDNGKVLGVQNGTWGVVNISENALVLDWNNRYAEAYDDAKAAMQEDREVFLKIPNSSSNPTDCIWLRANAWNKTHITFGGFTSSYLPGGYFIFTYAHITSGTNNWFKWSTNFYYDPVLFKHLAPIFSDASTYSVGDYVTYGSNIDGSSSVYKCNTAIVEPEEWNAAHWVKVTVMEELVQGDSGGAVSSVNGKTGAVILDAEDVGALPSNTPIPSAVTEQTVAGWGFTKNTGTYSKPSGGIPASDLAEAVRTSLGKADTALQPSALQTELDDNVPPARFVLVRNGNTITTVDTFYSIASLLFSTTRRVMFFIVASQSGGTVTAALELYPTMIDTNSRALTLAGYFDGNRYTAELTAASLSSTMTGTLVVEPIKELPSVTASDNGKFLRVVSGAWAAQTVPFQTPRVAMTASDTTPTLDPNKLYVFPEMATLAPTFATPTDNTIVNEYHFIFESGATATVLTLPASVLQPDGFSVEANMHYEISILEGAMTAQGWEVSGS